MAKEILSVLEYQDGNGESRFRDWFHSLPAPHANKVAQALRRMETGNPGDHKSVGGGVFEPRIHNPVLRIYFGKDGDKLVILLTGGAKTRQDRDIGTAQRLWQEYKENKRIKNDKL